MKLNFSIAGGDFTRAGRASSEVKKVLKQLGVDAKCIKSIVIALYEAEVNVVAHAREGQIFVEIDKDKIRVKVIDQGPGWWLLKVYPEIDGQAGEQWLMWKRLSCNQ